MNKAELVSEIAVTVGISKLEAKRVLETITKVMTNNLVNGEMIRLTGFGTFFIGKREARTGRNPRTGAVIKIKAANYPKFRASKNLLKSLYGVMSSIEQQELPPAFSRKMQFRDSASEIFSLTYENETLFVKDKSKKKAKDKEGSDNTGPNIKIKK